MKSRWLSRMGSTELVLVFGGWALGAQPFAGLVGGEDVLFLDDYATLDAPGEVLETFETYRKIHLIGFSFGVASAAHWLAQTNLRPTSLTAISGTLSPADAQRGIAPEMVEATAAGLTDQSFAKFCRRAGLAGLEGIAPSIDVPKAQAELRAIAARGPAPDMAFDRIWIPTRDRIVPPAAQARAWEASGGTVQHIDAPHVPFRPGQTWQDWYA